jgi:RNA polymerase sigma factor for flagellar operon FliA
VGLDAEEHALWLRYNPGDCREAQQALFFRYSPWAKSVARAVYRRIRLPQVEWADYAHNATVGLLEAMGRFDPARGIDFPGYAKPRVRGSVFNGLRSFLADYTRRESSARMMDRYDSFDGSDDGDDDVLGQIVSAVTGLGIGFLLDSASVQSAFQADQNPSDVAERHQMDRLLADGLEALTGQEKMVMDLHYQQNMPFVEIAELLDLSKGRISQIHRAAISRIRARVRRQGGSHGVA